MSKKLSASRWLSGILAAILLVPAVLSLAGVITMRVVLTDSMVPKINPGDLVVSANWVKPGLGEVAIYHERDVLGDFQQDVVHRVITINENHEYQFKGDNNQSMDALSVPQADVLGTVFLKVPGVGKLLTSAGLLFLLLIIGGITAIVYGIRALRK